MVAGGRLPCSVCSMLPSGEVLGLVGRAQAIAMTSAPALMTRLRRTGRPMSRNVSASIGSSKYMSGQRVGVNAKMKMNSMLDRLPDHVYGILASRIRARLPQRAEVRLYRRVDLERPQAASRRIEPQQGAREFLPAPKIHQIAAGAAATRFRSSSELKPMSSAVPKAPSAPA